MMLEKGTFVNDGEKDLLICASVNKEGLEYALLLDLETDELGIYNISLSNDIYDFKLVKDEELIQKLLLSYSKDFLNNIDK